MKIRKDFVTNSSSSSFVISLKDGQTYGSFKECVNKMIEAYNKLTNNNYEYSDIFDDYINSDETNFELWSAYDNSVPYWLMEFLESNLDCERHHHG